MYRVFSRPDYQLFFAGLLIIFFIGLLEYRDVSLILKFWSDPLLDSATALRLTILLLTSWGTIAEVLYASVLSILLALNITLFVYFFQRRLSLPRSVSSTGISGLVVTMLGFGCAACGSLVLTALATTASGSLISFLPYDGEELRYIGLALLAISVYFIVRAIHNPLVCKSE